MKQTYFFLLVVAAIMMGCTTHDLVNDIGGDSGNNGNQTPIDFNVQKQNITRATNFETVNHFNFGVWAWKVGGKNSPDDVEVMNNYLVGYSNETTKKGYSHANSTTWSANPGTTLDHTSPWFYEGLGKDEYTYSGDEGFYKSTDAAFMSKNEKQVLRYWDLAYTNTNFYCYAPYNANVQFTHTDAADTKTGTSTMTFSANTIRDGYDEPQNSAYNDYSRTLGEYMYAGVQSTNADRADVTIPFRHMGAQLLIRFYEDIPGYKVEIIDLDGDYGTLAAGITAGDNTKGIQATPAIQNTALIKYTTEEAKAFNATLTGALNSTDALTAEQALAYNKATIPLAKTVGDMLSETEATAYNATLAGALGSTTPLTEEQAATFNRTMTPETDKDADDVLSEEEAAAYNATLDGAIISETALTVAEASAYNAAMVAGVKSADAVLTDDEATAYNQTLPGAKRPGDMITPGTYDLGSYYTNQGATVTFAESDASTTYTPSWTGSNTVQTPLMFKIPQADCSTSGDAPANLEDFAGLNTTTHKVIQEKVAYGAQAYSYSPTIYYPVAQPTTSTTGLTFHISYRIIAEDNKESITVHNATVHVPYKGAADPSSTDPTTIDETTDKFITVWQPNVKYTYTFKFTRGTNGTTDPDVPIDPNDPVVPDTISLFPIVFDYATISDYTSNYSEYKVSEETETEPNQ